MSALWLCEASITELCTFKGFEPNANARRTGRDMWLSLPAGEAFPLYTTVTTVTATDLLYAFIGARSIYASDRDLNTNHYLDVIFRDDGTALIALKYKQILGSWHLCIVKQPDVRNFIRAGARS